MTQRGRGLEAGAAKARIDLEGVLPFDGFDYEHDPLYVRALVLRNAGGDRACLVSVDATSMRDDSALRTAAAHAVGCKATSIWVSVTHTFSVPHVRTPEHLENDAERNRNTLLSERLVLAVKDACLQAIQHLEPVTLSVARGRCSVNVNRDVETSEGWWIGANDQGFSDKSVRVLRLRSANDSDRTIAIIFTADVQSSVVQGLKDAQGRMLVSSDLAGATASILEENGYGIAIFMVGAAGDQAPRVQGSSALPELGRIFATEVMSALQNDCVRVASSFTLERQTLALPAQQRADFASLAPHRTYDFVNSGTTTTTLHILRLGDLTVIGVEPEIDSALGSRLREAGEGNLEVLTMVNGAQKYLPCADSYDRITYEAMNSGFARGAAEQLEQAILACGHLR